MTGKPHVRRDLVRGTATYYERYRVGNPPALVDDLLQWAGVHGHGRLLELACGTGQITFALHAHFNEVWAVDQEPEMVETFANHHAEHGRAIEAASSARWWSGIVSLERLPRPVPA